jgi:hypothetical protein
MLYSRGRLSVTEQFRRWLTTRALRELGRAMGAEAQRQGLTEEQLIEAKEEDRAAVYSELYGLDG